MSVLEQESAGYGPGKAAVGMANDLQVNGVTAFIDKGGRKWNLQGLIVNHGHQATARQAEVAAILTADPEYDYIR